MKVYLWPSHGLDRESGSSQREEGRARTVEEHRGAAAPRAAGPSTLHNYFPWWFSIKKYIRQSMNDSFVCSTLYISLAIRCRERTGRRANGCAARGDAPVRRCREGRGRGVEGVLPRARARQNGPLKAAAPLYTKPPYQRTF